MNCRITSRITAKLGSFQKSPNLNPRKIDEFSEFTTIMPELPDAAFIIAEVLLLIPLGAFPSPYQRGDSVIVNELIYEWDDKPRKKKAMPLYDLEYS